MIWIRWETARLRQTRTLAMSQKARPDLTAPTSKEVWNHRNFFLLQTGFWLTSAMGLWLLHAPYRQVAQTDEIISRILTGIILTYILHFLYQKSWFRKPNGHANLLRMAYANLAMTFISSTIWMGLLDWRSLQYLQWSNQFQNITIYRLFSLLLWNSIYFCYEYITLNHAARMVTASAVAEARVAELSRLQAQLNPHFLFNALSTIKASLGNPPLAEQVTQDLADLLRFSLEQTGTLAPLDLELEIVECYLRIQRARFEDSMVYSIEISPSAIKAMVPPMLIQPLLENAFKYGMKSSPKPLCIDVSAHTSDHFIYISVTNTGTWFPEGHESSLGTGIANLRRRLSLLSDEKASLAIHKEETSVTIALKFPLRATEYSSRTSPLSQPCPQP